jgi:hypothetical protein
LKNFTIRIFRYQGLKLIQGKEILKTFETSKNVIRCFCGSCGGRVYHMLKSNDTLSIPLNVLEEAFQKEIPSELYPTSHICYEERAFDCPDKLIKFQGVPKPGQMKIMWFQWIGKSFLHYLIIAILLIYILILKFGKK